MAATPAGEQSLVFFLQPLFLHGISAAAHLILALAVQKTDDTSDEALTDAVWLVARRLRRGSREALAPFDLSPHHFRALGVLHRHGPMRLSALSEHLHIAARSTTEVVDALEARGLAARQPDPDDRRATLVTLTEDGRAAMGSLKQAQRRQASDLFAGLSAGDRADLARVLRKLTD